MNWLLRIRQRLKQFWSDIQRTELRSVRFTSNIVGWFITLIFLVLSWQKGSNWWQVWIFFHGYYWYGINKDILRIIRPPAEILFFPLYLLFSIDLMLINSQLDPTGQFNPSVLAAVPHMVILAAVSLMLGLLIIISGRRNTELLKVFQSTGNAERAIFSYRQGALLLYAGLGYLAHLVVMYDSGSYIYVFRIVLFLLLLKKTHWLEKLSKTELNVYFVITALLFLIFRGHESFTVIREGFGGQNIIWFSLPYYFYLLLKMYLLAILVRLPVVMVYNHAGLSRKLRISSLLQSTVPQIIQFVSLILVFYFFISGWQSSMIREGFLKNTNSASGFATGAPLKYDRITKDQFLLRLKKNGVEQKTIPEQGVFIEPDPGSDGVVKFDSLKLQSHHYEFYSFSNEDSLDWVYLTRLDSSFMRRLAGDVHVMAASGLTAYSYFPSRWERIFYKIQFGDFGRAVKLLPFALVSNNSGWNIEARYEHPGGSAGKIEVRENLAHSGDFLVGRAYIPVINADASKPQYYVIDAFVKINLNFFKTPTAAMMLGLLLLFLLFNGLITQRVIGLGTEINKIIVQKFAYLKRGIREVATGNLSYRLHLEGEDEFVELAGHFNQMGKRLEKTIEEAREKDRLDEELRIARRVQRNMLSNDLPQVEGYSLAADLNTATEIGGDFYDFMPIGDDKYLFTLGDVSGKGSSAAFYMAQIMSLLRYSHQFTDEPKEIAQRINEYFSSQVTDKQIFITAIIGVLDARKHSLRFVRAGHTLPVLLPANQEDAINEIETKGLGIGLTSTQKTFDDAVRVKTLRLKPGDSFIIYSDGVVEATIEKNGTAVQYGEQRLFSVLQSARELPAVDIVDRVCNDLDLFYGEKPRVDDHTVLVIQRKEKQQPLPESD